MDIYARVVCVSSSVTLPCPASVLLLLLLLRLLTAVHTQQCTAAQSSSCRYMFRWYSGSGRSVLSGEWLGDPADPPGSAQVSNADPVEGDVGSNSGEDSTSALVPAAARDRQSVFPARGRETRDGIGDGMSMIHGLHLGFPGLDPTAPPLPPRTTKRNSWLDARSESALACFFFLFFFLPPVK